jgi:hypothetical protein
MAKDKRQMMVKIGDSTFDKIQAYYIDPELYPLTDKVEEIRLRWVTVVQLLQKAYSKVKIANMLEKQYGISQAQAYIDIRNAENTFGNVMKTEKEAYRAMWLEWTKDYLKRARRDRDMKAEGKALDLLAKYGDLDADSLDFNPEKLENVEIQINLPKGMHELFMKFINSGVVDLNDFNATEIDYEDVSE